MSKDMSKDSRRAIAAETVAIAERGQYAAPSGRTVSIAAEMELAIAGAPRWAQAFRDLLEGEFTGAFEHVVFAVWDTAPGAPRHAAFVKAFG